MFKSRIALCITASVAGVVALGTPAMAQMFPVAASGWNRDIVVESAGAAPYASFAQPFDTFNGWSWYERTLAATAKGLPVGGTFISGADGTTRVQFQPYNAMNALFMDASSPTGTLTVDPASRQRYDQLSIFASSSNGGGAGTLVITFTDATTSGSISFNAQDWFNVTTNNALNNLGRANLNSNTVDDASANNPRVYQTTIDMAALGLNTRNITSITLTKPAGGASQNTVVMAISGQRAVTQLAPVSATGWNRDIVVENVASTPYSGFASAFDVASNFAWYENGLAGSTKGLPQGGTFNSVSNSAVHFQLQPYNAPNALFLNATVTGASGTLTLAPAAQVPYEFLGIVASSAGGGVTGTLVINFGDGSSSGSIPFNAQDWFNTTTNNALNNLGRVNLGTSAVDDASAGNPRMYQTVLDLGGLGFNTRAVSSITFTKPTASQSTAVVAISGQGASSAPGACCAFNGSCAVVAPVACAAPGLFQGPGSACAAGACPAVVSACCNTTTGVCTYINGTTCASGSANRGAGSICSPSPCPQTGACCANTGVCSLTSAAGCGTPGLFQGLGTTCGAGNACPVAFGACCNNLFASCSFVAGATCPSGFTFSGPGTVCSPNSCAGQPSICEGMDTTATGSLPAGWTSTVATGVGAAWVVVNTQAHMAPNSVFTNDVATVSTQYLELPAVTASGNLTLDLWSSFTTESTFDGWTVEANINGAGFANIGDAAWILNGYNATISAAFMSPIAGQRAFSGAAAAWTERTAVIPATAGDSVVIRFNMSTDSSIASTGVWLDDICRVNISVPASGVCCRGSTCTTTPASAGACTGSLISGQTAGAAFVSTSSVCNSAGNPTTPCCYADYNKTAGITVQDIFDFLGDWFAGSPFANTGSTGAPGPLSVQNIFDFLNDWFAGGC